MAEKKYFTGVKNYNFNIFIMRLGRALGLEKKAIKPKTIALLKELWLEDFSLNLAEEHINGTATRFFRKGKKGVPGRAEAEKTFEYIEKNYMSAVKKMAAYLEEKGDKSADYTALTSEIAKGIRLIADSREELLAEQAAGGCIGYDPDVADSLADWVESISFIKVNVLQNYCLTVIAVLCYFFANGCYYPVFALPENKKSSRRRITAVPDREEGFKPQLLCEVETGGKTTTLEKAMKKHSALLVKGDGGAGKSTLLTAVARLVEGKDVVYIPAAGLNDDAFYPETFILRKMCAVFPQWQEELDYYSENNGFINPSVFDNALIFIDGLDECREIALLLDSAVDLIEKTSICFVFASRYEHPELKKAGVTLFRTCPLQPEKILTGEKKDIYLSLDREKQDILRKPMYLNIFLENDIGTEITYTALLKAKIERDITEKGKADKVLLDSLLADFALWKYRQNPFFKGFSVADIRAFIDESESYYTAEEFENELAKIFRAENNNYYIHHLNERDYLIALALADRLTDVQAVLKEFRDGFDYTEFTGKLLAELLDESLLESLRRDNMDREEWLSENTARATDILLQIFESNNISYTGLNLTRHGITGHVHKKGFSGALVKDTTFLPSTLDSAVFRIVPDGENIFVIGRNQVILLDGEFRQQRTTVFAHENRAGNHVTASAHNAETIVFTTVKGQAYIYDKATARAKLIMEKGAHSVTAYGRNMYFIGTKDGRIAIINNDKITYIRPEKQGEITVFGKKDDFYLYGTGERIKAFDGGGITAVWDVRQLKVWDTSVLEDLCCRQVIKTDGERYVALFYKKGISLLAEVTITEEGIIDEKCRGSLIQIFGYNKKDENEKTKKNLQDSVSVDRDKITSICIGEVEGVKYLFSAFNSGLVDVREWGNRKGYTGEIRFSADTFGQSIESMAFHKGQLVVAPSFRSLYSLELNLSNPVISYQVKKQLKGINVGVRRIVKDGSMLYLGCFNGLVALEEKDDTFEFRYKINLGGWCWAVCTGREGEIYAAAESTVYSVKEGRAEAVYTFDGKVENLYFEDKTNKLYVATEHCVKILDFSQEKPVESEMQLTGGPGSEHRPLCFETDKYGNMYIGFAAYENQPADVYFSAGENLNAFSLPSTYSDRAVEGWNRSVQVFGGDKGEVVTDFMLCGGLTDGDDHFSILWKKLHHKYIVSALRLGGHTNYITGSVVYSTEGTKVKVVSVAYDGCLNLYEIDTETMEAGSFDTYIKPVKQITVSSYNLYGLFVEGTDVYTCDAQGAVYRVHNPFTVFLMQSRNIYQGFPAARNLINFLKNDMVDRAEKDNYLFIFTDVQDMEYPQDFNDMINVAYLFDDIYDFVSNKGKKTVFGNLDERELKNEYAKNTKGDGYYYNVQTDRLVKARFIKF